MQRVNNGGKLVVIYPDVVKEVMTVDGFVGERKYEEKRMSRQIFGLYNSERIREERNKLQQSELDGKTMQFNHTGQRRKFKGKLSTFLKRVKFI